MFSDRASDVYASIEFKEPDEFYNREAPDPLYAWIVGSVVAVLAVLYWYIQRWRPVMASIRDHQTTTHAHSSNHHRHSMYNHHHMNAAEYEAHQKAQLLNFRVIISTIADNDDPVFTILRVSSQSMLFLAGFQLNYLLTLIIMCVYYTVISCSDSLRVLISLKEADCLQDLVQVSKRDRRFLRSTLRLLDDNSKNNNNVVASIDLKTQNVYEDVSRNMTVVLLVFVTQIILISFVVVDAFGLETHTVFDKTNNVPIVGTMGSYLVYVLGIFMQCVYILGPKTNFGTSEQNPHFWLQLLLAAKKHGCQCGWKTEEDGQQHSRALLAGDWNLWLRFFLSFVINGIGFHVLVHALPIQVAGQSNLTGIVIRAVGMMYLVDLDDAPGTVLKLTEFGTRNEAVAALDASKSVKKLLPFADIAGLDVNREDQQKESMLDFSPELPAITEEAVSSSSSSLAASNSESSFPSPIAANSVDNGDKATTNNDTNEVDQQEDENDPAVATKSTPTTSTTEPESAGIQLTTSANQLIERAREQARLLQMQLQRDLDDLAAVVGSDTKTSKPATAAVSNAPPSRVVDDDPVDNSNTTTKQQQEATTLAAFVQTETSEPVVSDETKGGDAE